MTIRYYNKETFELKGEFPRYMKTTQTKYINAIGTFEIASDVLPYGIAVGDLIHAYGAGAHEYFGELMQVSGDMSGVQREYSFKGREITGILSDRMPFADNLLIRHTRVRRESIMRDIIQKTCIVPENLDRMIPNLVLTNDQARGSIISYTCVADKSVLDNVLSVGKGAWYGVEITPDIAGHRYVCDIVVPFDRGVDSETPVIISAKFDNLAAEHFVISRSAYKNVAYYGIVSEDQTTVYGSVELDAGTGFGRKERWIAAPQDETNVSNIESTICMQLGNFKPAESFSGDYQESGTFTYGKDFRLGDFVAYVGETGASTRQLVGFTQTCQAGKYAMQLIFGDNLAETVRTIQQIEGGR